MPRWKGVNRARVSSSKPNHANAHTTSSTVPKTRPASRTPSGRHVCGSAGSETAGMDVGQQDAAGAEVPELVHQPLRAGPRHHRPDRHPALAVQRRDGGALDARRQRRRPRPRPPRGCRSPSSRRSARPGRPRAGAGRPRSPAGVSPPRVTSTASDSRITSPKVARPAALSVLPVSTTSAITSATPSWMLVSTAPSSRVTVASMPALLQEAAARCRRTTWRCAVPARSSSAGVAAGGTGEAEAAAAEPEPHHLLGLGAGVEQQVAAGDADVEGALADVQRDVARAQVEELHAVLGVEQRSAPWRRGAAGSRTRAGSPARTGRARPCWGRRPAAVGSPGSVAVVAGHRSSLRGGCRRRRGSGRRRASAPARGRAAG